jgi:hypothetical protein
MRHGSELPGSMKALGVSWLAERPLAFQRLYSVEVEIGEFVGVCSSSLRDFWLVSGICG